MKFMVFHPSWGYLAHDYGLVQVPVEIEGKEPKPAQLKELIELARKEGIKVIFVPASVFYPERRSNRPGDRRESRAGRSPGRGLGGQYPATGRGFQGGA